MNSTAFTSKILKKNNSVNSQKEFKNKNGNDEKKIKDTIFQLSIWDSEHLENSQFKDVKIINYFNQEIKRQNELIRKKEEVDNLINQKLSLKELLPKIKSERILIKNKSQIFTSKDKLINFKVLIKDDNENKLFNEYQDNLINKLKKRKYESILNDTCKLLESARIEYNLCIDIIKERIKSVEKYYNAFIHKKNNINNCNINSNNNNQSNNSNINNNSSNIDFHSNIDSNINNLENKIKMDHNLKSDENNVSYLDDNISNKTQNSGESKKKIKRKTNSEIIEEKVRKYNEFNSIKNDLLLELKGYDDRFSLINEQLSKIIKKAKEKLKKCDDNKEYYKSLFVEFSNDQKKYYLDILKKGTDTRNQGLTWVVKRLIELKVNIDTNMFPPFLDNEQIEYIINISKLGFEKSQLKLILNVLKHRNRKTNSQNFIKKKME